MDVKHVEEAVKQTLSSSKRNFKQKVNLIVNLKDLDLKKADDQVDFYVNLPHERGRAIKVCALVGPELKDNAAKTCDAVVSTDEFDTYQKDKSKTKNLAEQNDIFVAQANIMPKVAAAFGRVLGPRQKMPNPKAGCIVPPKGDLAPLHKRLQKLARVYAKTSLVYQSLVGSEEMDSKHVAENIITLYNQLIHHLPKERNNVRSILVKSTMGKPVEVKF